MDSVRAGLRISIISLAWTVAAGAAAVAIGAAGGSLVLVAFGAIGLLDGAGSATLVVHFRHALRHEAISEQHERIALRVVTIGMFLVGLATAAESAHRLVTHAESEALPAGVALAAVSALVLSALTVRKRRIARLVPSHALHADSWLSATGAVLAVVTLAGTGLTAAFGWWWIDPIAALLVAVAAVGLSVALAREEASG